MIHDDVEFEPGWLRAWVDATEQLSGGGCGRAARCCSRMEGCAAPAASCGATPRRPRLGTASPLLPRRSTLLGWSTTRPRARCSFEPRRGTPWAVSTTSSSRPITSTSTWRCRRVASGGRSCTGPGRASATVHGSPVRSDGGRSSRAAQSRPLHGVMGRRPAEQPVNDGDIADAIAQAANRPAAPTPPTARATTIAGFRGVLLHVPTTSSTTRSIVTCGGLHPSSRSHARRRRSQVGARVPLARLDRSPTTCTSSAPGSSSTPAAAGRLFVRRRVFSRGIGVDGSSRAPFVLELPLAARVLRPVPSPRSWNWTCIHTPHEPQTLDGVGRRRRPTRCRRPTKDRAGLVCHSVNIGADDVTWRPRGL